MADVSPAVSAALSSGVIDRMRELIASGRLPQGTHLTENELAQSLGVSRGPVREAFTQLAHEGFVELRRHRGAFVTTLTRADIDEVYSLRLALERLAAQRAAKRITAERLDAMDAVLERMQDRAQTSPQQAVELDLAFHDVIYDAAEHERLMRSWQFIRSQVGFFLNTRYVTHPDFTEVGFRDHLEIRTALESGDPVRAVAVIENHLNDAYGKLLEEYPE
jgi:DNA-binding GntR family transcriptional regulator